MHFVLASSRPFASDANLICVNYIDTKWLNEVIRPRPRGRRIAVRQRPVATADGQMQYLDQREQSLTEKNVTKKSLGFIDHNENTRLVKDSVEFLLDLLGSRLL